jgi:hypothetical protein
VLGDQTFSGKLDGRSYKIITLDSSDMVVVGKDERPIPDWSSVLKVPSLYTALWPLDISVI